MNDYQYSDLAMKIVENWLTHVYLKFRH